jgi:hypothetical protein
LATTFLFALVMLVRMQLVHRPLDVTLRCCGSKATSPLQASRDVVLKAP